MIITVLIFLDEIFSNSTAENVYCKKQWTYYYYLQENTLGGK